ncbi:hypothetical protein KKD52_02095 [Myxococcota bacterium]|nr:hypothetical protein [Myxococcota bacterium]MBU1411324.1 hypothetical protein [Myxococcota bacterium]MBU1509125.1 hypothetical protein [Myxococcota bacterium]
MNRILCLLFSFLLLAGCTREAPLDRPYEDNFERTSPGKDWFDTIGRYIIDRGALYISGGYNHPLWLIRPLPAEVEITLDARGLSPDGDLKIELFGDGRSFAFNRGRYWATGYVLCQGGWNNTKTFIARRDEHDRALLHSTRYPVTLEKWHRWRIQTFLEDGKMIISWWIDDSPALRMVDPAPLYGPGNRYFGFSNWKSDAYFDNLRITPLTPEAKARAQEAWQTAMQDPRRQPPTRSPAPAAAAEPAGEPAAEPARVPDPSGGIPE